MSILQKIPDFLLQRNQPIYSSDWFSNHIDNWNIWLKDFRHQPSLRFMEIGSYEGRSARWLLENILTHSTAHLFCIDQFDDCKGDKIRINHFKSVKKSFYHNIKPYRKKVSVKTDTSQEALRRDPISFASESFDFIYIDGSHKTCDVLEDAVLSFRLLKPNGIMVFDDYLWEEHGNPVLNPKLGIDAWLTCFAEQFQLIYKEWQVCIKKL